MLNGTRVRSAFAGHAKKLSALAVSGRSCMRERARFQFPPFKIPSFMYDLRVITAKCVTA